ncbi:LysR family transcriptional regulator [Solemya velesiana gill symbiont]|uniref:LysR family transcriptional regulator n=1 Tax=Solemya velesiana gill symbiont TaxID=1918948 RepID=A0A1T2KUQ7_9GAMM|nr:LysR family transcriptional regulator [Solemya velesiana gill symbiont]OOZ36598.1 LysR family transcriptional regulator [Solemya velesiana gill symbiont]
MDFNALNAFLAVAETESFSAAAARLYLTQPAISKRVAALEEELGNRLFDRIGRKVTLTEAGRLLLPRARKLQLEISDIRRDISNISGEVSGSLTMGTSHHIGLRRLPPVLKTFSKSYPQVSLDIHFMDSETACTAVEHGDLGLAIVTLPTHPSPNLVAEVIWHDPLHFVISKEHPLAKRRSVTLEQLFEYPAVLTTEGTYTREVLEKSLEPLELSPTIGMATNYLETLKMMVTIGLGWGLLPETMLHEKELKTLSFEQPKLSRRLGIVTHKGRTLSNAAKKMQALCIEVGDG